MLVEKKLFRSSYMVEVCPEKILLAQEYHEMTMVYSNASSMLFSEKSLHSRTNIK